MELQLQNEHQCKIADLLWIAQTSEEVDAILRIFGHDAQLVYEMMLASHYDEVDDVNDANKIIQELLNQ